MKKPKRRIIKNYALRDEMINKGIITPVHCVPQRLRTRGYLEAAKAAFETLSRGRQLYVR